MGEYVSVGNSIIITLFSIVMVFIILIIIAVFISMLKNLDRKKEEVPVKSKSIEDKTLDKMEVKKTKAQEEIESVTEEELIAVISAAVAASLGVSLPEINIKKINRINDNSPAWSIAGRQEQIYNKL